MEQRVLRLWYRPTPGAAPVEVQSLELIAGEGVELDHKKGSKRHVTLVFEDDWNEAAAELGAPAIDPVGRRANVLLSGGGGESWIGRWGRLGPALLGVKGQTAPCSVMDEFYPGLQEALRPRVRAGVWGRVHEGGTLRVGDLWSASEPADALEAGNAILE